MLLLVGLRRRFLRARRFDVKGALDQFQATEEWRATNQIDLLYENIEVDSYEESRRVVSVLRMVPFTFFVLGRLRAD
jgi:hypothetical protein